MDWVNKGAGDNLFFPTCIGFYKRDTIIDMQNSNFFKQETSSLSFYNFNKMQYGY